jgi:hypothetical protein
MTKDRVLDLALEALERMKGFGDTFVYRSSEQNPYEQVCEAITAIKQARSAPVREHLTGLDIYLDPNDGLKPKRYPAAQPAPVQEPVAWAHKEGLEKINDFDASIYACGGFDDAVPLYTTPPAAQRQWVGLTDEEIYDLSREMVKGKKSVNWLSYSIEAKLKERNG